MSRTTADALVISATGPDAGWTTGRQRLELMVRLPSGDLVKSSPEPKVEVERWIVKGMTVPVAFDPSRPWDCEVLTERITPLAQRLAEHDWTLCDLEEVTVRVRLAEFDYETGCEPNDPARAQEEARLREWQEQRHAQRPQGAVVEADGRLRGTADLISHEIKPSSRRGSKDRAGWTGKRLYRVWLFGHDPYPVLDEADFAHDGADRITSGRPRLRGGDVPVTVDPVDRGDVAFLWVEHTRPEADRGAKIIRQALENHRDGILDGRSMRYLYKNMPEDMRPAFVEQLQAAGIDVSPIARLRD